MTTFGGDAVRIEGLAELRGDFRRAARSLPKVITAANRTVARSVADAARPLLVTKNGKPVKSKLTAGATQTGGYVQLSGATANGDEFGSHRFKQFRGWRGTEGWAVFPTIRAKHQEISDTYLDLLEAELEKRGE